MCIIINFWVPGIFFNIEKSSLISGVSYTLNDNLMKRNFLPFLLIALSIFSCQTSKKNFIPVNNQNIRYEGRINFKSEKEAEFYWTGTSVKINFEGSGVGAYLKDERAENWYNIIIDSDSIYKINTDTTKRFYPLATHLKEGKHTIEIFKRTEWDKGKTLFYGLELEKGGKLLPPPEKKSRRLEFFGNSITCGYGNEDYSGNDSGAGPFENGYLTYAAITARHFNAETHYTAKSGIGITISWFPMTMPQMYNRLDPTDEKSKWNFEKFTPDLVVINLFQNDSWLVEKPEHESFKLMFGTQKPNEDYIVNAYYEFLKTIRTTYPKAQIIGALGSMDATREGSLWPGYIEKAAAKMNDKSIFTHFFPYKNTPGHPKIEEQKAMAEDLIEFIEKNIKW
jgi:hypothetical protein